MQKKYITPRTKSTKNERLQALTAAHEIVTRNIEVIAHNRKDDPQIPELLRLIDRLNGERLQLLKGGCDATE